MVEAIWKVGIIRVEMKRLLNAIGEERSCLLKIWNILLIWTKGYMKMVERNEIEQLNPITFTWREVWQTWHWTWRWRFSSSVRKLLKSLPIRLVCWCNYVLLRIVPFVIMFWSETSVVGVVMDVCCSIMVRLVEGQGSLGVVVFDVKSLVQRSTCPDARLFDGCPLWNTNGLGIVYCRLVFSNTYWQQPCMILAQICKHEIMTLMR